MDTTANITELYQIVNAEHGNPHSILGMHEIIADNKPALAVRVYIPQAESVYIFDPNNEAVIYKAECVRADGFFEAIITDRYDFFRYKVSVNDSFGNSWTYFDPYSFLPIITDYDRFLFSQGNHYKIYEKLGAHVMNVDGISGVLFAVWAPNAKRVSVIGDFNAWDGRRFQMRIISDSGIWELFVPGLAVMDKYKFEIKTHDNYILQKSDPYANYSELRPNTASVVFNTDQYSWNDKQWMEYRNARNFFKSPMSIYEVHLGSWKRNGLDGSQFYTYRQLADELVDYVTEMGYTHIELMPVEEHPLDGSWGYQVTGYFAPTSRYGTPLDFMYFVDKCHQHNIGVILDWVPAHFPKDAHGLGRFDGTALYEHLDPRLGEHPDWGTYIFNFGRNEVKNFLIANAIYWIDKYHIDGLRVDAVASLLYLDYGKSEGNWIPNKYGGRENIDAVEFLKHMNSIIGRMYPGVQMIAEESTAWGGISRPPETGGLGFMFKWNMGWMNDFLRYISKDPLYRKYHQNDLTFSMVYAYTENFVLVLSHDEVVHGKGSMITKMPGDYWQKFANLRVAYGFMFGHPGKKLLFMGNDFAQFDEWNEAKSLDWHLLGFDHHLQMQQYVRALNKLYSSEPSMWQNDYDGIGFEWVLCDDYEHSVVSFIRRADDKNDYLIFVCNFTPTPHMEYILPVPEEIEYTEVINSDDSIYGGSGVTNTSALIPKAAPAWNARFPQHITVKVPPLGMTVLRPNRQILISALD